jgi:hypothetical protein
VPGSQPITTCGIGRGGARSRMMFALLGCGARGFLADAVGVNSTRGQGPVATQTLTFVFADVDRAPTVDAAIQM